MGLRVREDEQFDTMSFCSSTVSLLLKLILLHQLLCEQALPNLASYIKICFS